MHQVLGAIRGVDVSVYEFLSRFAGHWMLDRLVAQEEANSLLKGALFFAIYWYVWFSPAVDQPRRRRAVIAVLTASILAIVVARSIAFMVPFRLRPIYDPVVTHPHYSIPVTVNIENWSAFPSDTASFFFALAVGVAYFLRRLTIPIILFALGWICLPRLYLGLHYASDVIVGIAIGATMVWISLKSTLIQSMIASRLLAVMEAKPHWFYPGAFLVSFEMATFFEESRRAGRAILHMALASLHRSPGAASTPLDEWAGLVLTAGLLLAAAWVAFVLKERPRHDRASVARGSRVKLLGNRCPDNTNPALRGAIKP